MPYKIRLRRDVSSDWISDNTYLDDGEAGYDKTNNKIKIGPGYWNDLDYLEANITNELVAGTNITIVENTNGSLTISSTGGGGGTPGGSDTQVQFNDGGSTFGGDAGLTYNKTTDSLTITGDLAVNGADITTTSTGTATVFNTNATTLNLGGAATTLSIGASSGTATIANATITLSNATTVNINGANPTVASTSTGTLTFFNTNLTTVNAFGAATAITIGATSGTTTTIRGGTLVGNTTTQNVFNTTATTVSAFGAATSLTLGSTTGNCSIRNPNITLGSSSGVSLTTTSGDIAITPAGNCSITPSTILDGDPTSILVNAGVGTNVEIVGNLFLQSRDSDGLGAYVQTNIIFEGTTRDGNETTLTVEDPTLDRTITLPDATGTVGVMTSPTDQQIQYYDSATKNLKGSANFKFDGTNVIGNNFQTAGKILLTEDAGSNFVSVEAPSSLSGDSAYILPSSVGTQDQVLSIASVASNTATLQWTTPSTPSPSVPDFILYNFGII